MARMNRRLAPLDETTVGALNTFVKELNSILDTLDDTLGALDGEDGSPVLFKGDIDLQGHNVKNVGLTTEEGDLPTRSELRKRSLFGTGRKLVAEKPVEARAGVTVPVATADTQAPNLGQILENTSGKAAAATIDPVSDPVVVTDPANSPATADALRDDLVTNALAEIRDQLQQHAEAINSLRTYAHSHAR